MLMHAMHAAKYRPFFSLHSSPAHFGPHPGKDEGPIPREYLMAARDVRGSIPYLLFSHFFFPRHQLISDLTPAAGGKDEGPSPKEYLMAALASCTTMTAKVGAQFAIYFAT